MDLIKIERRVPGTLLLKFQDIRNYANKIDVAIEFNQEFKLIPLEVVAGMFQIPSTLTAFTNGLWTMSKEDKERVFKFASEQGLYYLGDDAVEQPKVLFSETQLKEIVRFNRLKDIEKVLKEGNAAQKLLLAEISREQLENLTRKTIEMVEGGLGISLSEGVE